MKLLALDHGTVRTGVAVSDETGTIARPLTVVERVGTEAGFAALLALVRSERPARIVVGLPLSLGGGEHGQARAARAFAARLSAAVETPVELFDERYTSKLADQRGGAAARDARAAATLLEDYLRTVHGQGT
ncbi:MAG: Holliday junction resolvase RuvX [Actinobacteria bacterium]|nr:Holliday junction resolvase RuvX [Actinomycetota bacterium]